MRLSGSELLSPSLRARLEHLDLVSRKVLRGGMRGERRATRLGHSVEFADFRNYAPGDDVRFIDWNLYARLDRLFLKLFFQEAERRVSILLDASPSMQFGQPSKFDWARQLAAALAYIGLVRGDRVRIETLGQPLAQSATPFRGRVSAAAMLDRVASIEPEPPLPFSEGLKKFCVRTQPNTLAIVISDLLDKTGYREGIAALTARQLEGFVIQVFSPEERHPDARGDLRLIDSEDAGATEITASRAVVLRYEAKLAEYVAEVREYCRGRGIEYLLADSAMPVEQLVTDLLRRRGLVH
ncbi:MAG TPA: DUF58 domain-containing protein [Pirellulales bacterium]|jgi:uncharacterized protein (DUF58 family)|nr:DUF58 domain-containing protein [Pirellulales bacterium]